jgi:4-coumarate--CoA ligase
VKGYQVAPAELESIIKEHPDVLDAGVVGVPCQRAGERPKAFVVLKQGRQTQADNIAHFVSERVTEFKKLKEIVFLDSLPKTPSGKLLRRVLKEKYCS